MGVDEMIPLSMAGTGSSVKIGQIRGKDETQRFLASLGFVTGSMVTVVSEINGDIIVNVKDSRVALNRMMANKIFVS